MANSLYDRNLQESTLFELFQSESYSDTVKALKLAQTEITNKLLTVKDGTWTKKRLTSIQKLIDKEIAASYAGTLKTLQGELPGIADITAKNVLTKSFNKVPTKLIDQITADDFNVQGYHAKELFGTISSNHARQLRVLVGSGVAQGKPTKTIVNELMVKNSKLSKGQLKNAVFTTITEGRARVRHESYKQLEKLGVITGYQYIATLDSHTSEYCRNHDHRKYMNKTIDEIQGEINTHFHCRSIFAPLTKSTEDTTRSSQFGPIPEEPYGSWFGKQIEAFQKTVLGNKKFDAYQKGDYKVGGLPDVVGKVMTVEAIASTMAAIGQEAINLQEALERWTTESASLRAGYYSDDIDPGMESLFGTAPTYDGTMYRGLTFKPSDPNLSKFGSEGLNVGDTFTDIAPTSWSTDRQVGVNFGSFRKEKILFVLEDGQGYDIQDYAIQKYKYQKEVLLRPSETLIVTKVEIMTENYYDIFDIYEEQNWKTGSYKIITLRRK